MLRILLVLFNFIVIFNISTSSKLIYEKGVNDSEIRTIVDEHNKYRLLVANGLVPNQPRGINLKRMKWDEGLAKAAQKIANTCIFAHVKVTDDRWKSVGQNLALQMSTGYKVGSKWSPAIGNWFEEHTKYTFPNITKGTGHYTQMIWANTEYIGCGYTYYHKDDYYKYQKLYVCNYGPGGNYIKQEPYEVGTKGCENLC